MNFSFQDEIFMNIAKEVAKMSKCISYKVGCVLVKDRRIISTGYNGTPAGFCNCDEYFQGQNINDIREEHHKFSENFEIHAEMNAIIFAAKNDISIDGCDLYTTLHPCNNCLKNLCNSGIKRIFYGIKYDKFENSDLTNELIKHSGIKLIKIS